MERGRRKKKSDRVRQTVPIDNYDSIIPYESTAIGVLGTANVATYSYH